MGVKGNKLSYALALDMGIENPIPSYITRDGMPETKSAIG